MFDTGNGLNPAAGAGRPDDPGEERCRNALPKAAALQNAILTSANFSIIATDERGIIQLFNGGAERMLGYTSAEVVNRISPSDIHDPQEVIAHAQAVSLEVATPVAPGFEALAFKASRGIEDVYELTYIRKDGSRFPAMLSVTALRDEDGQIIGYLLIGTDITERKRTENALRASEEFNRSIIESSPDCIKILDPEGNLLSMQTGQELLGIDDIRPFLNKSWIDFWEGEDRRAARAAVETAVAGGAGNFVGFFRTLRGEPKWWDVAISPILDANGKPERLLAVSRDVTEHRRTEMHLALLASVSQDLSHLTSVDEMMRMVGAKLAGYLNLSLCAFAEINEAADQAVISHDWHRQDVPGLVGVYRLADFVAEAFIRAARMGEIIVVRDTAKDLRTDPEKFSTLKIASFVCAPLLRDGQWRFALCLYKSEPYDWREDELALTREVTLRIWTRLERLWAEEALRNSEERYRSLFDSMDEGYCVLEMIFDEHEKPVDYRFLEVNSAFEEQSGMHDATGKRIRELVPDIEEYWIDTYGKVALTGEPIRYVNEAKTMDSSWFDVNAFRLGGPKSRKVAVLFRNIKERKDAEKALRESEERYRNLFTSIDEGFCVIDMIFDEHDKPVDYRFLEVNPTFGKQTGLLEATGKRMRELVPDLEEHWFETYGNVALTGEPIRFVNEAKPMEGRWFDVYACRVGGPESRKVAIVFDDITRRKQSEEALRQSHVQLQLHSAELGRFNRVAVGRELRMIELKKEINELCLRHGVAARYALDFEQDKKTAHA